MKLRNLDGLTMAALHDELIFGGRFVTYQFCISFLFFTFRPSSDVYFLTAGKTSFWQSLPYTFITFLCGWWGLPWGPLHTIGAIQHNLKGGTDVTELAIEVLLAQQQVANKIFIPSFPKVAA